jgi:DNA-binding SARP family transcriptional activator/ABC-type branched-subunit amino acid transport system substrate-binding protein
MDFLILGPLELRDGSEPIPLTGARQRGLLALLLLHRNEVLGSERLIDDLWGESPPPTAAKALQNAVLQVRRALGEHAGALRTEGGGYILRVEPGELDADRFEQLHAEGRAAIDAGDHAAAAKRLRDALALWRGPAFADLAYERFAQPEIARLEDERVAALEDRIEADLALGRHAALVPELEAEVARHPLRERLRAQLMTALYGAGRQAEALEAFHDTRRTLLDELGIEPGPELRERHGAILRQDPALLPRGRPRAPAAARSRLPLLAGAAAVLLLAAAAAAAVSMSSDDKPAAARLGTVAGNSLVAIDPRTASITATYPVGSTPTSVTAGAGGAWTLNADDSTLSRVAARTSAPRTFAVPDTPLDVAAGANGVWTLTGTRSRFGDQIIARRVLLLDPATSAVLREVTLPEGDDADWFSLNRLALGGTTLWALGAGDRLTRIDTAGNGPATQVPGVTASTVAASGDGAWALTQRPRGYLLVHLNPAGRVTVRVPLLATDLDGMAAGAGAVWITAPQDGLLWRVTPDAARSIPVAPGARGVTVADGKVWVANASRGTVTRVDPRTNRPDAVIRLGNAPRALAWDGERLWVSVAAGGGGAPARDAARAASGAVTAPACSEVIAGGGTPQRLIVSDMPLHQQGISYIPDAIAFVLRNHDFRAGRFRIGYQSCDDSTAKQGSYEVEKCKANAGLYVDTPRVIGIIGPYNSDCAAEQLAITNRAGPLATISPTNTVLALTKPVPGGRPGETAELYPTGRRHYARVLGTDSGQGAALALFARQRGVRRLAIVQTDEEYGRANAWYARREARRLGIPVTGVHTIDFMGTAARARALAQRIARERPAALLYAGVPYWGRTGKEPPGYVLLRALRARFGQDLLILGPDSFNVGEELHAGLGPAARGIHISTPGVPLQRLGPAGRRFVDEFGATQPGGIVPLDAVYAAEATEVLLDAIARSDGSRASVTRALLATKIENGLIGDVSFDADGDIRPQAFTIVRFSRHVHNFNGALPDGSNIAAVLSP